MNARPDCHMRLSAVGDALDRAIGDVGFEACAAWRACEETQAQIDALIAKEHMISGGRALRIPHALRVAQPPGAPAGIPIARQKGVIVSRVGGS